MAVDSAALLAAAIRAACQAGAPRRTVQAVASAVTGVLIRPAGAVPRSASGMPAGTQCNDGVGDDDAAQLLSSLRLARSAQRKRKKERRKAAKLAATGILPAAPVADDEKMDDANTKNDAADQHRGIGEPAAAVSAPASTAPAAVTPPQLVPQVAHSLASNDGIENSRSNSRTPRGTLSHRSFSLASSGAGARRACSRAASSLAEDDYHDRPSSFTDAMRKPVKDPIPKQNGM